MKLEFKKIKDVIDIIASALLIIIIVTFIVLMILGANDNDYKRNPSVYIMNNEYLLDYYHTKSEVVDEVQQYISSKAPGSDLSALILVEKCDEYDIDIRFVLAQGLKESHFGTKGLARKTNSVWNVYAFDGLTEDEISSKGKYTHPNESIEPYLKLLRDNYLVGKTEYDLLDEFVDSNGNRYATATEYESSLQVEMDRFEDSRLDSLLMIYNKQKLRLKR